MEDWEYGMMNKKGKKKQKKRFPKNAFYFFMMEYNEKYLEGKMNDLTKLQSMVSDQWQRMGPDERKPYEIKANKVRNNCADERLGGVAINDIQQREDEKMQMLKLALEDIERRVGFLDVATTLQTTEFYFFHANSHVRTVQGIVVPCEVALCRFTLKGGVIATFNEILNIRNIPLGYAANAKEISESTHHIPVPAEFGVRDAKKLYLDMLQFLMHQTDIGEDLFDMSGIQFPPVYTVKSVAELAKECLGAIVAQCYDPADQLDELVGVPVFNVYPIEELLFQISKKVTSGVKLGNKEVKQEEDIICQYAGNTSFVYMKFFNDPYTQAPGIACKFHEDKDCREYCSQACVIRMGYIISNCCCNILGINRQIWRHYPKNHIITYRKTTPVYLNTTQPAAEESFEQLDDDSLEDICRSEIGLDTGRRNVKTAPIAGNFETPQQVFTQASIPEGLSQASASYPATPAYRSNTRAPACSVLPPTCSILSDEEDDNEFESTSVSSFASFKYALDTTKVKWVKNGNGVKSEPSQYIPDASEQLTYSGRQSSLEYSNRISTAESFKIESQPEMGYLKMKKILDAEKTIMTEPIHQESEADSVASVPLERYQRRQNYTTDESSSVYLPKPSPVLTPMLKGLGARRQRYQYYDEEEADRAALILSQVDRETTAQLELAQQSVEQQMNQQQFAHGGNYMGAQQPMWHGGYMEGTQQPAMTMTTPAQLPPHIAAQAMLPQGANLTRFEVPPGSAFDLQYKLSTMQI